MVGSIGTNGMVAKTSSFYMSSIGVSPAINIDRSKVLFTKRVSGIFNECKLSLMQYGVRLQKPIVTRTNNKLEFLFTSESIDKDDYISALVTRGKYDSENAEIIKYQHIKLYGSSKEHYGDFNLPDDYDPETDHVYLIEEKPGYNHHSDIVTTPLEINVPIYKLTYDANGGVGEMKEKRMIPNLNKFNLKIVKPTLTLVGGSGSANATLEGLAAFNKATGLNISESDITYAGRDGTNYASSKTAPTAAGKYTASITVGGVFASVDYSIVLRGDVNNDGRVNMKDLVALQRLVNGWTV